MENRTLRLLIGAVSIALVAGLVWTIYALLAEEPEPPQPAPVEQVTQFARPKLVGWQKGRRQWQVEAHEMHDTGSVVTLERIEQGVIYKDDEEYFTFQADRGEWLKRAGQEESSDLTLTGNVRVYRQKELVFSTEKLLWQGKDQMLVAPGPVQFSYDGHTAQASNLSFNAAREEVTMDGEIDIQMSDGVRAKVVGQLIYNVKTGDFQVHGTQEFEFNT